MPSSRVERRHSKSSGVCDNTPIQIHHGGPSATLARCILKKKFLKVRATIASYWESQDNSQGWSTILGWSNRGFLSN
eukprot:scaffold237306_cov28-Tisochrysis_lutea.AAC.3